MRAARAIRPAEWLLAAALWLAPTLANAEIPADLLGRAEAGDAAAQYEIGRLYERGAQVPRDDFEAVRWFARAAENGSPRAALDYGWMLANGYGVTQDEGAAYYWFARAAAAGMPGAADQRDALAERIEPAVKARADARIAELTAPAPDAPGGPPAPEESGAAPLPAADLRDVFALRRAYNSPGRGDDAELRPAVRRQAELGDALAQNLLGVMLMRATARADKLEALEWFRNAAWQGLPAAQFNLADALALGVGGERDLRRALALLEEAKAGLPSAVPSDYESASRLFAERAEFVDPYLAAMQGYRSAGTELGQLIEMRRAEVLAQLEMARRLGQ
ncbi:MAG: tetratricopeptide repeat protein [Marivibrio sp.]|uniref:tetratricopeptide repeat protein n=1 Tax=Marivibrio sp. TaxID=2039719 RepID=UPI0032EF78BF